MSSAMKVARLALAALLAVLLVPSCAPESSGPDRLSPQPPRILTQPADQSIVECDAATFEVTSTSGAYQWFVDGVAIPGASSATYTVPRSGTASSGKRFSVTVSNAAGTVASREALLAVSAALGPVRIVPGGILGLAADGQEVFYSDGLSVSAASIDCEGPVRPLYERASLGETVGELTLAGREVVWSDNLLDAIRKTTVDGGSTQTLFQDGVVGGVMRVVVAGDRVVWLHLQLGLRSVPLGGGPVSTLLSGRLDSDGLAADDAWLYWYDLMAHTLGRMPLDGGPPETIATGLVYPSGLAADGAFVYWADTDAMGFGTGPGSIWRVGRSGGEPVQLAAQETGSGTLALDGGWVYWAAGTFDGAGAGSIRRVPADGSGAVEVLAEGLTLPYQVVVGARHVFFTAEQQPRFGVWRIPKPAP
jgi:hypothetical protein